MTHDMTLHDMTYIVRHTLAYTHTRTYTHTHIYTHTHTYTHTYIHTFFSRGIQRFALSHAPRPGFSQGLQLAIDMRRQNGKRLQGGTRTSTKGRKFLRLSFQGLKAWSEHTRVAFALRKGKKLSPRSANILLTNYFRLLAVGMEEVVVGAFVHDQL